MAADRAGMVKRAVTAFFDDRVTARQAVDDLAAAGVARARIAWIEGGAAPVTPVPSAEKGLLATIRDVFMADEDRQAYGEGLRRGGVLLSVTVAGDEARIVEVLDCEGAVDMDARESDWALEGWDPVRAAADPSTSAMSRQDAPASAVESFSTDEIRAAIEPVGAVGPAFAAGEAGRVPQPAAGRAVRDLEAEGLRLRTYMGSHHHPDRAG